MVTAGSEIGQTNGDRANCKLECTQDQNCRSIRYRTSDQSCTMMESNWRNHNGTGYYYPDSRYELCEIGKARVALVIEIDTKLIRQYFF